MHILVSHTSVNFIEKYSDIYSCLKKRPTIDLL